ncbi:MAG: extracellular solute-binding protein [Elusimicrobiales bacterium]|nr:extracellular solute-binding protein [Elusimicrobiales bacterium]
MLIWLLSDYDHRKHLAFKGLLGRFSAAYPDVHAEFAVKSRKSMWESLFAHLRDPKRNPLADVIEIPQNWTELFARLGLLAELSSGLEALAQRRYPEFVLKELCRTEDTRAYSAPWWLEAPALYYRPQALKGAVQDPEKELASWDGFRAALDRIRPPSRRENYRALSVPGSSGSVSVFDVLPRVWGRRGGLFSDDFNRATFNREETLGGVEDWLELAVHGKIELFSGDRLENGQQPADDCAFLISGRKLPGAARQGLKLLPYPGYPSGGGLLLVHNLGVSASTRDHGSAAAFVAWAMEPRNSAAFAESFGAFPCLKPAFEERLREERETGVYRRLFSAPELMPNIMVYPTAELLLERALWNLSLKIARNDYEREDLTREMIMAQGEADYLLSLY